MGAINIDTYAKSLRCSWYKRIKDGLWAKILTSKVNKPENSCYIRRKDIHAMHISILPIVDAFEELQKKFLKDVGNNARMNTPLDQLELIIQRPATRTAKVKMAKPTKTTHPFLFSRGKICEITGAMLTTKDSLYTRNQTLRPGPEIWEILQVDHLLFLRKYEILNQVKKLYQKLIENRTFKTTDDPVSLPEMFNKVKKGSQKYKTILLSNPVFTFAPKNLIEKTWKISEKPGRETFYKKAFSFWKNSILPSKIQLMLLKICNHQLKLNSQLKHFAVDESGVRIKPECTFCVIAQTTPLEPESYKHFFLECPHSLAALRPIATKYKIPLPNLVTKGELVLYYFPWDTYWDEIRINVFFAIYKYFLISCRARKKLPTTTNFEMTLRYECKYIIMTNPTNENLTSNLLPLWTGKELTRIETLELLEEVEGRTEKGKLFRLSNKNTVVLKTKVMNNFRFPITSQDHLIHRLNKIKNNNSIKVTLHC